MGSWHCVFHSRTAMAWATCGMIWELIRVFFFGCHGARSKGCLFIFAGLLIRELPFASD